MALVGLCKSMCPETERKMREKFNRLSIFEILPGTEKNDRPKANPETCVKEYSRSAAGLEIEPMNLRPPNVLMKTMDFLIDGIIGKEIENKDSLEIYDFVADRIRSVVQDATVQRVDSFIFLKILQKAVRFHIVFLHELRNVKKFNRYLCLQQLYSNLSSFLIYSETDPQVKDIKEMFMYQVLLHIDSECEIQNILLKNRSMVTLENHNRILKLVVANSIGNFVLVLKILEELPYMMSCCLMQHIGVLRAKALNIIIHAYYCKGLKLPVSILTHWLKFDNDTDAMCFCDRLGYVVRGGMLMIEKKVETKLEAFEKFENGASFKLVDHKKRKEIASYIYYGE